MRRYTIILEFLGGTYIDQVIAPSASLAVDRWADAGTRPSIPDELLDDFISSSMDGPGIKALTGLVDVWSTSLTFEDNLALLTIVGC